MNVFYCDHSPAVAAASLADRHVVKMAVESAQLAWTAASLLGLPVDDGYRPTHAAHPCTRRMVDDLGYRGWALAHGLALCDEYRHRYGREHGSEAPLRLAIERLGGLASITVDPAVVPQAMPEEHKVDRDPVTAYRRCLRAKYQAWGGAAKWTRREVPAWMR